MFERRLVRCEDGGIREPVFKSSLKSKIEVEPVIATDGMKSFDKTYRNLACRFLGEEVPFYSKQWTFKKVYYIKRCLSILSRYKIGELELFLLAQFYASKTKKQALRPSVIASSSAIKTYRDWLSQFSSLDQAKKLLQFPALKELISSSKQEIKYLKSIGWPDEVIFERKAVELNPIFLVCYKGFLDYYRKNPKSFIKIKKEIELAFHYVSENPSSHKELSLLVNGV